jgi:hypothetical protein
MPLAVSDLATLKGVVNNAMWRADHHGPDVQEILLPVIGGIVWRADAIRYNAPLGVPGRLVWITIGSKQYAFSYRGKEIHVVEHNTQGPVIERLSDDTSLVDIKRLFQRL